MPQSLPALFQRCMVGVGQMKYFNRFALSVILRGEHRAPSSARDTLTNERRHPGCRLLLLLAFICCHCWHGHRKITNMVRTDETRAKIGQIIREQWADPAIREVSRLVYFS